ncbi:MAG: hypothetical protein APF76_08045 [Desulfitibacter sp. BRH_c19]|nr:MAG: hypothetical protein APF76_08045 [Desulfitibacter sp. BRH_c19]
MFKKNEEGSAMIVAILVVLVLTLLGTALWNYSMADTIQTAREEKRMQAYYLARSGAEAVAENIVNDTDKLILKELDNLGGTIEPAPSYLDGSTNRYFEVKIERQDSRTLLIESIGTVDDLSQKVTVKLVGDSTGGFFNMTLLAKGDITFSGNKYTIDGSVGSAKSEDEDPFIGQHLPDDLVYDVYHPFPRIVIPSFSDEVLEEFQPLEDYSLGNTETDIIDENTIADSFDIRGTLTFSPTGNEDMYVIVDEDFVLKSNLTVDTSLGDVYIICDGNFNHDGTIEVYGGGNLIIYANYYVSSGNSTTITKHDSLPNAQIFVWVFGPNGLDLGGTVEASGGFYADIGDASIKGTITLSGSVIANNIKVTGDSTVNSEELEDEGVAPDVVEEYRISIWGD